LAFAALIVYVLVLFIRPQEWVPGLIGFPILDFVVGAALVTWLGSQLHSDWRLSDAPQNWLMLGLFAAVLMSHVAHTFFAAFIAAFQDFGKVVLLYFLIASLATSLKRVNALVVAIVVGCLFLSFWGIYQAHSPEHFGFAGYPDPYYQAIIRGDMVRVRALGIFNDPNDLALMLVAALPFLLGVVVDGGARPSARTLSLAAAVPMLYCIYLTNSRGGWLALGVMLMFLAVLHMRKRRVLGLVGAIAIALALLAVAPSRIGTIRSEEGSARGRLISWGDGNSMLKRWPLFGAGQGRFTEFSDDGRVAHNSFVHCWAELGLVGYFFWLGLAMASLKDGWALGTLEPAAASPSAGELPAAGAEDPRRGSLALGTVRVQGGAKTPAAEAPADAAEQAAVLARMGRATTAALIGFLAAAFFLSRTYEVPLYILFALATSLRGAATGLKLPVPRLFARKDVKYVVVAELASIPALYVLLRVMN
jgi:O-antigen ligase